MEDRGIIVTVRHTQEVIKGMDATTEAHEMLAVYRARLSYAEAIQREYKDRMAEFDRQVAEIEKQRASIVKEFENGPAIIATYTEKVRNQYAIIRHVEIRTKVVGRRVSGKPIRTQAPIDKLRNLRRQMAKIQGELDNPEEAKIVEAPTSRWDRTRSIEGVKFMRDRKTHLWSYADEGGGRVYGPFDKFSEARENASV